MCPTVNESCAHFQGDKLRERDKLRDRVNKVQRGVNKVQRGVLVQFTDAFNTTSTEALCVVNGIMPVHLEVIRRVAMYWVRKNEPQKVEELLGVSIKRRRLYGLLPNVHR